MLGKVITLVAGILALGASALPAQILVTGASAAAANPYRNDRILVQPKANALAALAQFQARHNGQVLKTFPSIHQLQVLSVPANESVTDLISEYQRSGLVDFAEPDYLGHLFDTTPNDPYFVNGKLWGLEAISAPAAWDVRTDATNVIVAVVDTGIRYTHEDLAANMWVNPVDGGHGWNALDGNNDPTNNGATHGTMVAGILGAVGNNGKGVTGVPWHVQIMACAGFNSLGIGSISEVITCLDYARTNGAQVINASWGFTNSLALSNAMVSLRDAGIIVVAAAGNSATNIDLAPNYPAGYGLDNVVTVGSLSPSNTWSTFSNFGVTNVALGAPGEQIYTTFPATDSYYYADPEGATSYAAPFVTGACALLMAQYPADSYRDTIARLLGSTDVLPALAGKCRTGGRLDLAKAMSTIRLAASPFTNGPAFQFSVSGGLNRTCSVEASTNLADWSPVFTNTSSTNGTFGFTDLTTNSPQRFYRAAAAQ
jgi:hypothetical protein